ncbi:MAG: DEAD/DEAH box helicase [Bacteriovoracaceae bacterium]|jgi:superfamily II DNA/RNA helicase|nr:DEAD/DEAH box helicase [Bacteriovoracaceae bacterium]
MNSKKVSEFGKLISNVDLLEYLKSVKFSKPTQVQGECIPQLLRDGNYTVQGRTGSGKTLGYLLPLIQKLKEAEVSGASEKAGRPKAIILLPTRELAIQVFGIAKGISHFAKQRVRKLVGGDKGRSLDNLYSSEMDILVTTPDRCLRAFKNKELSSRSLKYLIFDEADQLLESSFKKTVAELTTVLREEKTQVFLISASRPANFSELIVEYFPGKSFKTIGKGEENVLNHEVKTYNITLENEDKFTYINSFIKEQNKKNGLIFMGNKARAKNVFKMIQDSGMEKVHILHKDLEIKERVAVVEKFRKSGGIMVATDIFARGIDITHLQWVLNFDLPSEPDYYLHRSGRVGRAGRAGSVFNFVTSKDTQRRQKINDALVLQGRNDLRIASKKTKQKNEKRKR